MIVSSDDTKLTASGGIAKRVLEDAGEGVRNECKILGSHGIPHGHVTATSAGDLPFKAIIHAAVVDRQTYNYRYPTETQIRSVARHSLSCAAAFGARSVVFPVIGGGTGARSLTPWDSIRFVLSEYFEYIWSCGNRNSLRELVLCVYKSTDIVGDLEALVSEIRQARSDLSS